VLSVKIIHLPKLGTRVRLIGRDEAFTETNFITVFLFIMYNIYVATVSSLIKLFYLCFEKFYIFLSLLAA